MANGHDKKASDEQDRPLRPNSFHDWNALDESCWPSAPLLLDETLRDGLQSPSAHDPPLEKKIELLHMMAYLGLDGVALGYPAARARQYDDVLALAQELAARSSSIVPCCAARTLEADIRPIIDISQRAGIQLQVGMFIGSSPMRQQLQGWHRDEMLQLTERAVRFAVDHGLSVLYVTEDTTRSSPEMLAALYGAAIRSGASRICLADTVGHATPAGTRALVRFVRRLVNECDERVGIDWHGHSDRGLALANSLAAWEAGAERCHGTALGIGERSGNTPIELLLANLVLLERRTSDLTLLPAYVRTAASALGFNIAPHHPIVGRDAFRTATGTHAAAIVRAEESGDSWAAERIYSGVPASWVGRDQVIEIGPLSGEANVVHWLRNRGIDLEEGLVETVLDAAKHSDDVLNEAQIKELVSQHREIQARERTGINTTKARSVSRLLFQASAARQQARRSSR